MLRKQDHMFKKVADAGKAYGPVFTVFFGHKPCVIVTDFEVAQEAFRKTDVAGKPMSKYGKLVNYYTKKYMSYNLCL